ncbi:response regulator transcription factor [Streptomyces sp. NPDC101062]|uniref:response regulator transcription factor n=1 Tax=unclassified Streptomyces TaxID=2593676 RepID=UPI002E76CB4B|nr:response regulator transcription factor [Streptomyces sp. JV176]MEE1803269.1 response regulator transcription factor [Streptomyces sp. JV176]
MGLVGPIEANPQLALSESEPGVEADVMVVAVETVNAATMDLLRKLYSTSTRFCLVVDNSWHADYSMAAEYGVRAVLWRADFTPDRFVHVIRLVNEGWADFPSSLQGGLVDHVRRVQCDVLTPRGLTASGLSAREIDVLRLAAEGHAIAEISQELSYSERTIKNIFYGLMKQLNLRNRTHVVSYAIRAGLI